MQQAAPTRQPDLSDLVLMMELPALAAFVRAIDAHYLSVDSLTPDTSQEHLLRYAYLVWCKRNGVPYVAISRARSLASTLLDLGPVSDRLPGLEEHLLDKVASCAAAGSIASDQRRRFVVMLPPACAAELAAELYLMVADCSRARQS